MQCTATHGILLKIEHCVLVFLLPAEQNQHIIHLLPLLLHGVSQLIPFLLQDTMVFLLPTEQTQHLVNLLPLLLLRLLHLPPTRTRQ